MTYKVSTPVLLEFFEGRSLFPLMPPFNRIEGRPRSKNFDQALRAEVRDPLWMLARQWQVGEFKGDDAGSPVTARVCLDRTEITRYRAANGETEVFDNSLPLETRVEQRRIPFATGDIEIALDLRLVMGRHWVKLLGKHGFGALKQAYIDEYSTHAPDPDDRNDTAYCANRQSWQKHAAATFRHVDGKSLYDSIRVDPNQHPVSVGAVAGDHTDLVELGRRFVRWFDGLYAQPDDEGNDAWLPSSLEYRFACSAPKPGGEQVYKAEEYYHGHLDWYNFSIDDSDEGLGKVENEISPEDVNRKIVRSFIPTPVKFDGMPNTRWWAFEDGKTNFGDINPDTTDLNKLLLMEFGLIYANDWYLLPVTMPAGSILNVRGLSVQNVFGENLWLRATGRGIDDAANRWTMYSLDVAGNELRAADLSLVVVPSVPKIQESEMLEEVQLTRDEMANMVWGIETRVSLPSGKSTPGSEAARDTVNHIKRLVGDAAVSEPVEPSAPLRYRVMSSVPENWIPFITTHVEGNRRKRQLQRGSMPRIIEGDIAPIEKIKPRTSLLRHGLDQTDKKSYFVHEEEVPRSGIIVRQSFQRTRWYNGKVLTWLGVRKRTGRGESASQLKFDYLKAVKHDSDSS